MDVATAATDRAITLFHALSDRTRLELLGMLRDGERCVCELTLALDAAQSRLSFHLKVLKDSGLVTDRREGRWVYYALNRGAFAEARLLLLAMTPRVRRLAVWASPGCG